MHGKRYNVVLVFVLLFVLLALPSEYAQELELDGIEGIPFPVSPPTYREPVTRDAFIIQGNDGEFSHDQPNSRFAWDYDVPVGTPVVAARGGVVFRIWNHSNVGGSRKERFINYGNFILIDHLDGTFAQYFHLAKDSFTVRLDEYVLQGEQIACSGDTGFLLGPHLHYAVFDSESYECISTRFCDFRANNGIPRKGDRVAAAAPCLVPADVIRSCKQAYHAGRKAENMGMIDLAWQFAADAIKPKRYADYFYIRVLTIREERFKEALISRLEQLAALEKPMTEEIVEAVRYTLTLDRIRDWDLKWKLSELRKRLSAWEKDPDLHPEETIRGIDTWLEGVRLDCEGDLVNAAYRYIDALALSRDLVHDMTLDHLKSIIREVHAELKFALSRCAEDRKLATARQVGRVKEYTQALWLKYRPILHAWVVYFPDERKRAIQSLQEAKLQVKSIVGF